MMVSPIPFCQKGRKPTNTIIVIKIPAEKIYQLERYISLGILFSIGFKKLRNEVTTPAQKNSITGHMYSLYSPPPLLMPAKIQMVPERMDAFSRKRDI